MTDTKTATTSIKESEEICLKCLQQFVRAFCQFFEDFKRFHGACKSSVERMKDLKHKLTVFEKLQDKELKPYTREDLDDVAAKILCELNDEIIKMRKRITELADSEQDIAKLHSEFMATASIAQSYDGSSLVKGCHNRKSLSYYMDESVKALYQLKTNINLINRISKENGFHDDETYEQLQSIVSAMGKAHENIEEFVLYSKPLTNSSQRKCQK